MVYRRLMTGLAFGVLVAAPAHATIINFDDQGLVGPDVFASATPSPQHLDIVAGGVTASFDGGVILTNTAFLPANETSVYGTAYFGTELSNPLTITFSHSITNFFVDVLNGLGSDVTYQLSDNAGNSSTFTLAPNLDGGKTTIGFAATGTVVTLLALSGNQWDFFVDNIGFNEALPPDVGSVPLPAGLPLLATGIGALGFLRWRRNRAAA
ncbi:VPLPA-CTERM sorting domain-containing protein [Aestuariivirga sp.]|uniref:VPLPA-CTERM sorting domain-containing protein n=1 Tax=Aestuariivirga sp. TaxID=2650926 RepID=UPI0039E44224